MHLLRHGTSYCTATWDPSRATSARGLQNRKFGRTPFLKSTHELIGEKEIAVPKGQDPRLRTVHYSTGLNRLGVGGDVPWYRQAWRRQWRSNPPRATEGLGSKQSGRTVEGVADTRKDPAGL